MKHLVSLITLAFFVCNLNLICNAADKSQKNTVSSISSIIKLQNDSHLIIKALQDIVDNQKTERDYLKGLNSNYSNLFSFILGVISSTIVAFIGYLFKRYKELKAHKLVMSLAITNNINVESPKFRFSTDL